MVEYSRANIEKYIEGIYDGSITEYDLPESLYAAIGKYFEKGLYKGFGMNLKEAAGKDLELLAELRENTWLFAAAKTFQQTKDIGAMMFNDKGDLIGAKEFNELGTAAFDKWNNVWGTTEYNTAVGQAQNAVKWNEIEKQKKVLPMLRYSAVVDANTSDICLPLDGIVAPVGDPIWDTIAPENHFNCRCLLIQEEETVEATPDDEKEEKVKEVEGNMSDLFKMNPGKDGYVFKDDHPYFQVERKDKEFAKENFGLPMPEGVKGIERAFVPAESIAEAETFAKDNLKTIIESYKGVDIDVANQINKTLFEVEKSFIDIPQTNVGFKVSGKAYAQYDWKSNTVNLRKKYENIEQRRAEDNHIWKKQYGNNYHVSTSLDGVIKHEFAHAFDNLTGRELYKELERLPLETKNKMYGISGYASIDRFFATGGQTQGSEMIAEVISAKLTKNSKYDLLPKEAKDIINKYFK